ncbi:hypothetical protein Ddye_031553 [Dipteronia dyeriana]|uniref:Disease resistance R13L4/SHOC-2-like LRR domain-containing protein n=1 Tax=Dipteronia dyeriana TaxID=168575 RepID=A0AAD9TIR8_9ROSI|nr:hypothetical protein Ddye_031553 [Dipteronia dyeriana]
MCNLHELDLSYNGISGEITEFIEALSGCNNSNLHRLYISSNKLSGNLPVSLGNFKHLEDIRLRGNSFIGALPTSVGNLSHLQSLDLAFNKMNGTIPETVGQLTELIVLDLSGNLWQGFVTENHLQNLTSLDSFVLSSSTSKSLGFNVRHDWIAPFRARTISISDCQLGGAFPSWLRTQKDVEKLTLSNVAISDSIPDWFWRTIGISLYVLDLSVNQLRGELPKLLNFRHFESIIDLGFNRLEGSIPMWSNVRGLSLRNNLFSGAIPLNIGHEMSMFVNLDLSRNLLTGSIPESMGEIRYLSFLDLSNNYLSGEIPSNWHNLEQLRDIDLSRNNFSGGIPSSICSLPSLVWLKLNSNNLSEELSVSLKDCKGLLSLDLGENKFFGSIPIAENLFNLSYLGLRGNRLTGNIPEQLCRFPKLHILDLARNNLSGYIPKCLGNLEALKFTVTNDALESLILFGKVFLEHVEVISKGRENEYTRATELLKVIDLSSNNLAGEIQEEITNFSALNSLNLSWNQLTGKIPENIQSLQQLETLDLSGNHLSGSIPPSMSSMTFLNQLNLSYNNLSGPIPTTNQFQTFNDPSIYKGNQYLCGPPLTANCSSGPSDTKEKTGEVEEDEDRSEIFWLYVSMALGFIVGFWAVCGTLIIKRSWRHAYFGLVDETKDKLHVFIAVHMARLRRRVARQMLEDTNVPQRK